MNTEIFLDGLDCFRQLFPDVDSLVDHVVQNTRFFPKEVVFHQACEYSEAIRLGKAVPVRYNSNKAFFRQHEVKTTTPRFANKKEALAFTKDESNAVFHRETGIRVRFDSDGNYFPKKEILKYTGLRVSWGKASSVVNYTIAHIWGKTDNPLFFSLLWNYALVPCHCAFLTDRKAGDNGVAEEISALLKAVCIELYNPDSIMGWERNVLSEDDIPAASVRTRAQKLLSEQKINFLL